MDNFLLCEQIGFIKPTIVRHNNETYTSQGLDVENLVARWRMKLLNWSDDWVCLGLNHKDYKSITKRPFVQIKSVAEKLYEYKVICIDIDEVFKLRNEKEDLF